MDYLSVKSYSVGSELSPPNARISLFTKYIIYH